MDAAIIAVQITDIAIENSSLSFFLMYTHWFWKTCSGGNIIHIWKHLTIKNLFPVFSWKFFIQD